ncbi:MAG TPA: hypothetical protein VKV77_14295 [Methylovirgula sp.]|nr:hypothetical protein [Methylovirgula sp.]
MSVQLQIRRNSAANLAGFVAAQGEIIADTTNNRLILGDGTTSPGWAMAKLAEVLLNSQADTIAAHAGGGQASATLLVATINRVTTVASAADSVKLSPSSQANVLQIVINDGANALQLFGSGSDTINGAAATTGISLAAGKVGIFFSSSAGIWRGGTLN